MSIRIVGAALVRGGAVLASRRTEPPSMAGRWEFAGGKVEPGESDEQALVREVHEELGLDVVVGEQVGPQIEVSATATLRVLLCSQLGDGEPLLVDHDAHRWLGADRLDEVDWLDADRPVVEALRAVLATRPCP